MRDPKVAGALFDFCGFLTTRKGTTKVGSAHVVGPVLDALKEWAGSRDLDIDDADVMNWSTTPPTGEGET